MDNRPREIGAESYVASELIKHDFKVVKPAFDQKGADLLILEGIEKQFSKFLIVQSKGRSISTPSFIKIDTKYVTEQFILFLYTVDEDKNSSLYLFFPDDIKKWTRVNGKYVLTINKKKLSEEFSANLFTKAHVEQIKAQLLKSPVKKYTSLFIDGIFLEKALKKAIAHYGAIWPDKKFKHPDLNSIVRDLLNHYDKFNTEMKIVNCYVFLSESFHLETLVDVQENNLSFTNASGDQVNVFINKSNQIIAFEILDQLERLINTENVILVADDITYVNELEELKEQGADIILVRLHEDDESNMIVGFRWGDVMYPLAQSIGLSRSEW